MWKSIPDASEPREVDYGQGKYKDSFLHSKVLSDIFECNSVIGLSQ